LASPPPAQPRSGRVAAGGGGPADTTAPASRGRSSCSPKNRLARASDDLSSAGCRWAWPIAYRGNADTQVHRVTIATRGGGAGRSRQVSLTMALTTTYVRAAMIVRRLLVSAALAWPG